MKKTNTKSFLIILFLCLVGISQSFAQPGVGIQYGFSTTTTVPGFAPTYNAVVNAASQDNSMVILAPSAYTFPFAGTNYPFFLTSTNGWTALLPASDLSAVAVFPTSNAISGVNTFVLNLTSTAGVANGMYVSGPGILGGQGYAFVVSFTATTVTLNVGFTTAVAVGATYNFFNLLNGSFNSTLPTNILSTYSLGRPFIAPLWDDLITTIFSVNFSSPNYNIRWSSKWGTGGAAGESFNANFNNATGLINFNYPAGAYTPVAPSASIGIAGVCAGDYYFATPTAATTAKVDSAIADPANVATRPVGVAYIWNPISEYDNCSGAFPAKDLGTINTTCTFQTFSNINSTAGTALPCAADVKDVWFQFSKPAGVTNVLITTAPGTCQASPGTSIQVFSSCGGASLGCTTSGTTYPTFGELNLYRPCTAEILYVRVVNDGDVTGKFQICVKDNGSAPGAGATCGAPTYICSLPYNQTGLSTAGSGNDYDSANVVCHSVFAKGEDYIFTYTPTANQCIRVSLTSAGSNPGVFIYNNCPDSSAVGSPTYCLGSAEAITGNATINSVTLTAGVTYYIMVDNAVTLGNIPFSIVVTSLGTSNTYDNCATPIPLGSIGSGQSCVFQTFSTECSTPSAAGSVPIPSCVSATGTPRQFIDGVTGDVWLTFTAAFTGALQISSQQSGTNPTANAAMAVYTGTCGAFSQYACDANSGPNGMPSLSIPIVNGTTYYIRFWSENPESQGNFDICLQSACAPPNDLPCGAVNIPLGGVITGYNSCTGATSEPLNAAQCVAGGTINTVWYKVIVPASGQVHIRTHPLTLTNTQIQAYTSSGGCSNVGTFVSRGCNDNGPGCSGGFIDFSDLLVTGLTPNDTLYIAVDGVGSLTGSFEITAIDGTTPAFPPVSQQDCAGAQVLCSTSSITVADPGFRNYGNICDLPSAFSCWGIGERNSVWYQFTVDPALAGGTANLTFDVLTAGSTDIDLLVWDITGLGNYCASIQSLSLPSAACNYAAASASTGLTTAVPPYAYSSAITFTGAPRTYLLLLNNYNSAANAGYTLNWGATPISTATTTAIWSGGTVAADTNYACNTCWGACGGTPACGIDAIVNPSASSRQPTISSNQAVKNITINAGAKLRIKSGFSLTVCGNFTNNGTLICEAGSSVIFIGNTAQTITGSLTGANSFANLVISKGGGAATLNSPIDVAGNFSTNSITSVFNINGKYMRLAGNFNNHTANTTFGYVSGSTLEFNGTTNQFFNNLNGAMNLYNVIMNKNAGKLYLSGGNSKMQIENVLTLTKGIIDTRSNVALEVFLKNNLSPSVIGQNNLSWIDGKFRRAVYSNSAPYTNYTSSAAVAAGATSFTSSSVVGLAIGMYVTGTGLPGAVSILGIAGSVITVSSPFSSAAGAGSTYTFSIYPGGPLTLAYSLDFPVGDSIVAGPIGGYNLANITFTSGTVIPEILCNFSPWPALPPPLGPTASECVYATYDANEFLNNGFWTFSKNAPSPFNGIYKITLGNNQWSNTTGSGWTVAKADIAANPSLAASWSLIGGCVIASTTGSTQRTNVNSPASTATSFNFLVATAVSNVPLPIELLSFTAEPEQDIVVCRWVTASETNNDYFEVEKSDDGIAFKVIGTVKGYGAGSSTTNRSYRFNDEEKCSSIRYYRLRQVDIDGKTVTSDVVAVNCKNSDETLSTYPNPASESITYQFYQNTDEILEVKIIDVTGREIRKEIINSLKGFNTSTTPIDELAGGVYYIQIRSLNPHNLKGPRQASFLKK